MKTSDILINVQLDADNVPEQLAWSATDTGGEKKSAKAVNISIWDHEARETLKMDLWCKDMAVDEMKIFYVDMVGSMAETLVHSTGDTTLANIMKKAARDMMQEVEKQYK